MPPKKGIDKIYIISIMEGEMDDKESIHYSISEQTYDEYLSMFSNDQIPFIDIEINDWTESDLKDYFIEIGFSDSEANSVVIVFMAHDYLSFVYRDGDTVYTFLKAGERTSDYCYEIVNVGVVFYHSTDPHAIPGHIPLNIEGKDVVAIGANAFQEKGLSSVTIPATVKTIGARAFQRNNLTSVELPNGLEIIEHRAFEWNQIASIVIPDSVNEIGQHAFGADPNHLLSVTIGAGVTSLHLSCINNGDGFADAYSTNGAGTYTRESGDHSNWNFEPL